MDDQLLSKIFEKVEKISDDVGDLKVTTVKQQVILEEHVKRSNTLEEILSHLQENEIEPLKEDVNKFKGALKFVTIMASLGSGITLFLKFFGLI